MIIFSMHSSICLGVPFSWSVARPPSFDPLPLSSAQAWSWICCAEARTAWVTPHMCLERRTVWTWAPCDIVLATAQHLGYLLAHKQSETSVTYWPGHQQAPRSRRFLCNSFDVFHEFIFRSQFRRGVQNTAELMSWWRACTLSSCGWKQTDNPTLVLSLVFLG